MKKRIKLRESELRNMIANSVKKALTEGRKYVPNATYIVFDGTSHYAVYGCDVEDEIMNNDVEVVKGPFAKWDDRVDQLVDDLNDEANGVQFDPRMRNVFERRNRANKLTKKILSEVTKRIKGNKKLNEQEGSGLWAEIRFVQGGDDDYEQIEQMFCGYDPVYCEGNSQPVIDYLKQWDGDECEITPNQPRIARNDTSYADENGEYTLLYNSSIGGDFLLYRPANEQEIAWYENNGSLNESIEYDDYASISNALEECGWAYTDSFSVKNRKTGQIGERYIIEPYPNNPDGIEPMDVEEMKRRMTQIIGENNIIFTEGQHRQAPEIKNLSMVVFDNSDDTLNESANVRRYKGFQCVNTSKDPSFPTYSIVSPEGETIGDTLFPSEMKEIVDDYLNGNI